MLHAIIMAGGSGTRFWPLSRAATPKQLLQLTGERTMVQMTVDRLGDLVTPERTVIVTNERLVDAIARQLPDLPAGAVVGEPCRRDTAPCIGLAATRVLRDDADAIMAVMPADHVIPTDEVFRRAVRRAVQLVDEQPQRIVTFGIKPTYPAEIFGYIHRGEPLTGGGKPAGQSADDHRVFRVRQFREKPNAATAAKYVESGEYYWNSGIFVWRAATILDALAEHQPQMLKHLKCIDATWGTDQYDEVFRREFTAIKGVSIDYAVMEHATDVAVIEAPFEWDDVGSWQSLARLKGADDSGNTVVGRHLGVDTHGTIVRSDDEHLVVTLGLEDCIVVHTPNATLVANKHDEESIRQVVEALKEKGWDEYL